MTVFDTVVGKANVKAHVALVKLESTLNGVPGGIKASPLARTRMLPPPKELNIKLKFDFMNLSYMLKYGRAIPEFGISMVKNIRESFNSIKKNSSNPKNTIDEKLLEDFSQYALSLGCGAVGFCELTPELIFKDRTVLFTHVIVLIMEMNKEDIALAPHPKTFKMVGETYSRLGVITNKLANFLRSNEFAVHAGHPLCGISLYVPLAIRAGLGWGGRHGLLITPQFGSRQRISVIYTNIENLPLSNDNPHAWISDFCSKCGKCIKCCEPGAIFENPIKHESGTVQHIDTKKCMEYFLKNYGCSVCVKQCPFSSKKYEQLKESFVKSHKNNLL